MPTTPTDGQISYQVPKISPEDPDPLSCPGDGALIILGSDLVLVVHHDGRGSWQIRVCDGDGTELAVLAHLDGESVPCLSAVVPLAAEAAIRLYPHHLLKPF